MELKISLIFGFISLQILKPSSSHLHSGSLGDIEFSCPAGQYFNGGNCYAAVSVPMTWSDAKRTCKRQGQHLFWVLDVDELKAVDHLARSTWEYYWSGLSQTESWLTANEALWSHSNETVSLEEVVWEDDQPDTRNGKCVFSKKNGYGAFGNCLRKLPFVCKSEAVLKDYFRCRSGEGIQSKFVCDGHNDCQDMSDEADCASRCHHVINAEYGSADTKPSGVIVNTNNYLNSRSCFWSIVTNVGSTIKVQVNTFNTEKNADVVEFRTGGREGEIFLAELTGKLAVNNQPVYYSSDNVFNIRLVTDNTVLQSGGFRISWTTDVPEVFNDVKMLTATTSVQDLKSPFYDAGNFPQEKVFEWKITASTLNVITLEFENLDIGKDSKLYLWDQDDISLDPTLDGVSAFKPKHYISKSKSIRLMLITGREEAPFPKGLYIKYWEGCSISYMSKEGTIQSPGYIVDSYPENVVCTWTIQRPTSETRTMALRFNMFDLQDEQDYLKIYNDTNEMLHTGKGFTGTDDLTNNYEVRSTNGYIKLVFTTNYVLTDKGFEAEFSLDCAELAVSEETRHISTSGYETSFMNTIEMSCDDGYSFVNEGRSNVHFIKCEKGGEWNETRIPNCMNTYCPIPPPVDNGYIVESSGVKVDNNVTYKCYDGFTMNGEPVIKCLQDGNWEVPPRCTAATCPVLTTPGNGSIETLVGDGRDFASVVQYVCNPGYETYGNVTTYCQTGGKWSHEPPTCEKISCPMPRFQRGNLSPNDTLKFDAVTTLTCDSGFGINGTKTQLQDLKCESDGRLSLYVACLDVDECNGTISPSPCPDTEDCHNTIGSHMCTCKDGYERIGNNDCSNINECSSNNGIGPCHQTCTDLTPGYTCGCNPGFVLYTAEGISNISLADGEDGEKEGDVYHINHTCVRKQCAVPPPLTNGKVLSKKELFFFEDSVEFTCDHGYNLSTTNGKLGCQSDGSWSSNIPSCQMATCPTPTTGSIARSTNIYPSGSTVDYNKEVNIECQYGSMKINRTLYCSYNVMSGRYELLGDAPECPEIDCGPPEEVPGSMYSGLTNTNLDSTFTFDCKSGFERSGMLMDGTYTVKCQENGRWNIGNLTCTGGRCKDPGTPGGAMQVVTSYEVGQMVYFKCNNSGYFPEPPQPLECVVDTNTGNITWNATVEDGSADLPECLDKTPPVFSNCPSDLIYVDKTEEYTYPMLTATDNSGAVKNIHNPGGYRPSGLRTNSDFDITYTAEDFSENTADCVIKIRVKDYARHQLTCPQNKTIYIGTATGAVFNVSDVVSVTPSDSDLTFMFSPGELITLDYTAMVKQKKVVVTATDKWGAEDQCSFLVETKADACFRESFPVSVPNAAPVTCTSGNISCTVTCNNGYVFFDGNTTKTYECTGQNMWMPALPPDTCIKYDEPSNIIVLQVAYKSTVQGKFAKDCIAGHDDKIKTNNASLTNDIYNICNIANLVSVGPVVITNTQSSTTGFDFRTIFTIRLSSTDPENIKQIPACLSLLGLQFDKADFLDYTGSVQCNSGTTTVVRLTSDSSNQVISSGNQCDNGIKKMTTVDSSSKCIPCPPGTYSESGDDCNICPDGKFQSNFGQNECLDCPSGNPVPSEDKTTCLAVCPAGFISVDGLPTCLPCPENHHWVNKTYCEPCPNSGNTLGKDAIPDVNGCKAPCNMGEYSVTGYAPCKKCPVNFYQDQTTQEMCKPCGNDSITQRSGSNDSSFCIQLGSDSLPGGILCCEICAAGDSQCCSANCSQEASALTCEDRCDDAYNNTLRCQCNSGCVAADNCCDDYQWKCVDTSLVCTSTEDDCSGNGTCSYKNHRKYCTCNLGYKGDNCEMELDPCDSSPCWNDGVCTKITSTNFNCTCPVDTSCEMIRYQNKVGDDSKWGEAPTLSTIEACENYCLTKTTCKSVHYESNTCFVYYQTTLVSDKDGVIYSEKHCSDTQLFGCDRCEDDLVNSCKPDTCSEYGMCQDLLGDNSNCLCPITGSYTGPKCERVSDLCNPDPCGGNGECYDYSVRYQCVCKAGWTGTNCEMNINECVENPNGCLYNGTCMDQENGYGCTCNKGFTGDRCKDISDFCSPNPCREGICYENYDTFNFMCKCEDPYRNDDDGTCEMIPACDNVNCTNGTCSSGKCICETGFEGSLCQHNIDDCMNMPCQHGGTCTDMINSYDCQCVTGYDGDNCENDIDDCMGMCTDPNTNGCRDMLNDYRCNCKAGYTGKNCTEEINECKQEYPCEHGGTCTDKVADFECSCREGWTGKRCETPIEYCDPLPCLNGGVCFNLTDDFFCRCPGGTTGVTCGNSPEVCSIIDPCTMKGTCQDKDGTAQCNCIDDYAGTSCQLIKDHCADPDMCNNEGQCVTNLIGFKCECDDSFSGSNCSLYTDPCSSNPCHSTAKCISNEDKYMCYCEQGNTLTDSGCKVINTVEENFDIFMDRYIDGMPAYLRNPIVSHTNDNMTIMFWIRVLARPGENPVLLSLEGIQIGSKPTFNPEMQQFIATSQYLILHNSTDMEMVQYGTDVADGKWHFMVFSWEPSGEVKIFIDSIKKIDENLITFDMNEDIIMQMIIGSADTHGRISKVRIYKTVFSDIEIYKAKDTDLPSNELVQGWTNIVLSRSTFRIFPSARKEKICDLGFPDCPNEDRTKPSISCPDDQTKVGTERLTAFTGLKNDYIKNEDAKYVNTSVHEDELYIYGSSNEVFVAYDEAMNYDICRFKVYVKYADECQMPETDAVVEYCPNSKHICGLNCPSGKSLSLKHKLKYRCGALGVYNFEHPRKKFILPTCGGQKIQKIALTIDIAYKIVLTCTDALKNTIQNDLNKKLKQDLANKWPGLDWCNDDCVWNTVCSDSSMFHINVTITLPELDQTISRGGLPYAVKDAILIFILQEDGLNFNSVGGAQLEGDSVTVDVNPSCSPGYTVVGDTCVECGKGTYRNDTTMSCEFCPIGSYQPNVRQTDCTSCQTTKTTLTYGSDESADCIDDCEPGQYYDIGNSVCAQCERHHYQDMSGQEFCYSCPLGMKTSQKGSNSSESCYKDCDAGTELQSDGSCKVCERGFYRTQEDDQCKSCEDVKPGNTTEGEKSASASDCKIKICYAGNFRNATTNECEMCPFGWYQSEKLQDECEECPTSYTTDALGRTHIDNCTFYCEPGMEVVSAELKTCRKCPRGSYRSNNEREILLPCQNCTGGNTTELDGRKTMDECSISKCEAGQILDNTGACEDCGMDTYQPDELPKSDTTCLPCNANTNSPQKGTMDVKSTSLDKCILVCKEGQQNDGTSCSACPQGTWSNGNMTMKFGMCYNCSEDWTTEGMGSTHPDNCTLRDCDPGHYISGDNCEPCGFAQYQPNRHADMCLNCSVNQNTSKIASTSQSACQIYCPKGQEGNVSCADCQTNYIKQTEGIAACMACEGNSTSNAAHDACSEMFCDKGLYLDMGICVPCEVGKYKDERGNDNTCRSCNAGNTTAGSGSVSEQDCNVLYCEPGKFENTTSNRCEVCPVKTYKSVVGNTDCINCIASKTTTGSGTTSADGCSLEYCSPGYIRTTSNNCEKCAVGKYQPEHGMITCLSCDTGYTTASTGTVDQTDCYQICPIGFQFDSDKKVCVGCLLGYYKDKVGNAEDCMKCPVNKTTEFANSTAINFCSVDDCPAGYRRESPGCVECEKGTYQNKPSQMTCDSCGSGYTTEKTGSTKQEECIKDCVDGMEYDFATKACTECVKGFYTNHAITEKCIQCPSGQTTAYGGSNICYKNTVTTSAPPQPSTIEMEFVFFARFDCNDQAARLNYRELVRTAIIKQLETLATTYPLLCTSGCTNLKLLVISITTCTKYTTSGRRRRAVDDNQLSFNVQVPDVPATVTSIGTNTITRPAGSVIQEDLTINKDRYAPLTDDGTPILTPLNATVSGTIKSCPTGQTQIGSTCVDCPVGTRSSSSQCIDCELNTYQDEIGQATCKACSGSVMKYTLTTGSNSSSQCISICVKTPRYCNFGTCHADQYSIYCTCTNGYEGSRCNSKAEKTSSNTAIIGGAVGGGVGLLVIILIVVIVCSRFYGEQKGSEDPDKKKFSRTYDMESDAPYRNPMYDNKAYPRPMLTASPYNWGPDPYDHDPYAPYMAQKQIRGFESDEDYYQPRGTPKGSPRRPTHEWHAAEQT